MMIGASLYPLAQSLRAGSPTRAGCVILTGLKWVSLVYFFAYTVSESRFGLRIGLLILALSILLVLVFWGKCGGPHWYQNKFFLFLGRLSLPLFLSHHFYAMLLKPHMPDAWGDILKLGVYNSLSLLTAGVVMLGARGLRSLPPLVVFEK